MWQNLKKDPSTKLDRDELRSVVDSALLDSKMYQRYEEADLDDLYMHFSTYESGKVSQAEMWEFLRGMTRAKPPGENYPTYIGLGCVCCSCGCFKDCFKRKPRGLRAMAVETAESKKKKTKKKDEPAAQ